ncbi:MAG: hypothetical protein PVH29_01035 [Candidatus Zixiibacteriota bacterium]|jgi:hypothetical protein
MNARVEIEAGGESFGDFEKANVLRECGGDGTGVLVEVFEAPRPAFLDSDEEVTLTTYVEGLVVIIACRADECEYNQEKKRLTFKGNCRGCRVYDAKPAA